MKLNFKLLSGKIVNKNVFSEEYFLQDISATEFNLCILGTHLILQNKINTGYRGFQTK